MLPRIDFVKTGVALVICWTLALVLFRGWPLIDLRISALFWDGAKGFDVLQSPVWEWLRNSLWNIEILLFVFALAMLVTARVNGSDRFGLPARASGFIVLLFLLGPGLIVNGFFKSFGGRARPASVEEFGGGMIFTPAGTFTDQCHRNCSFPSGEVSSMVTMAISLWLVSAMLRGLPDWGRIAIRVIAVAATLFIAAQRIIDGRHFLSDAVFATLMILTLAWVLYFLMTGRRMRAADNG